MSERRRPSFDPARRSFMRGALATAGATAAMRCLPRFAREASAAVPAGAVFPTIFIQLRGGWDPCYHFAARTGLASRGVTADGIKQTAAGVRWYQPTLNAMTPHMED